MALRAVGRVVQLDEARRAIGSLPDAEDAAETLLFESDLVEHGDLHGETGELGQRRVGDVLRAEPLRGVLTRSLTSAADAATARACATDAAPGSSGQCSTISAARAGAASFL
jgi:hypothetical protein